MRTTVLAAAGVTALALVAGGHGALANSAAPTQTRGTILEVVSHDRTNARVDVGRKGFGAGDEEVSSMTLEVGGKAAGKGSITCQAVRVSRKSEDEQCSGVLALHEGSITFTGLNTFRRGGPAPFDWAVTGGTGAYSEAIGYLHVIPGNHTVHMTLNLF
jgi:hypothetical protein